MGRLVRIKPAKPLYGSMVYKCGVTPLAGVWIETSQAVRLSVPAFVTPLAGVWIETSL